jgi:hypothetical protein
MQHRGEPLIKDSKRWKCRGWAAIGRTTTDIRSTTQMAIKPPEYAEYDGKWKCNACSRTIATIHRWQPSFVADYLVQRHLSWCQETQDTRNQQNRRDDDSVGEGVPPQACCNTHTLKMLIGGIVLVTVVVGGLAMDGKIGGDGTNKSSSNTTMIPTLSPAVSTQSPTGPTDPNNLMPYLERILPQYSLQIATNISNSTQGEALAWLKKRADRSVFDDDYLVQQLYAMAVLHKSTDGNSWRYKGDWLQTSDVCTWYGIRNCTDSRRVTILDLTNNNLVGDFPTELELMTEL